LSIKNPAVNLFSVCLLLVLCFPSSKQAAAQAPFYTDDIGVAERGHLHFEFNNEYDWLRESAFPNLRQNTTNFKTSYGLFNNVEVGFDNQLISIFNSPTDFLPRTAFGYGDLDLSVKWNFRKDQNKGVWPALAASLNIELPTGDAKKQLGSGITDYYLNGIAQKSLNEKTKLRINGGMYFAGNTLTGAIGIRNTSGVVFTAGASLAREFTPRLNLGMEVYAALSHNFDLGRGQLQTQLGGNYKLRRNLTLDFGLVGGFYQASPRTGPIIGFSVDF
jgi:hypothetical protein